MVRVGEVLVTLFGGPQLGKQFPSAAARAAAFDAAFLQASAVTGVPVALLKGIAAVESGFAADAVNPSSGTVGLMQIHPIHFSRLGWRAPTSVNASSRRGSGGSGWNDPAENILAGAEIFADGYGRELNLMRALARYNGALTWLRGGAQPEFEAYAKKVLAWATLFQF